MQTFKYKCPIDEKICSLVILSICPSDWANSAIVVGNAMNVFYKKNVFIGDLVIEERLRNLVDLGFVDCNDRSKAFGQYKVKKADLF